MGTAIADVASTRDVVSLMYNNTASERPLYESTFDKQFVISYEM